MLFGDHVGANLEIAARRSLAGLTNSAGPLRSLYQQPDRATFLAAGARIVLKVYADAATLEWEWAVVQRAQAAGLPVAEPLAFTPGPPAVIAMRYVDGLPLTSRDARAARETGRLLRQFHRLGARPPFSTGYDTWERHILSWAERELSSLAQLDVLGADQIATLRQWFVGQRHRLVARPIVLLHGDLQPAHVIVDELGERVVGLLDFADAQPGDPLLDIAVLTLRDTALTRLVLEGYGQIVDNPETETLLALYRLLRLLSEVPWLLERRFTDLAVRNVAAIRALLDSAIFAAE